MTTQDRQLLYWYQAPVGFVFVLFVMDRWHERFARSRWQWFVDIVTILLSVSRTVTWFLPLSGHTLFLSYAIVTGKGRLLRGFASLVLIEAIAINHFWLNDDSTPWVGLLLGLMMALADHLDRLLRRRSAKASSPSDAFEE